MAIEYSLAGISMKCFNELFVPPSTPDKLSAEIGMLSFKQYSRALCTLRYIYANMENWRLEERLTSWMKLRSLLGRSSLDF